MQADDAVKKIIENEQFKKELAKLSGDTLTIMSRNHEIARNYARDVIEKTEPEKLNDEYIELVYLSSMRLQN